MNVLVVGGGGREHAICAALKRSPRVDQLYCAPGNAGIAQIATCVDIQATDIEAMVAFVKANPIDFVMVAPDDPLALGMVDAMEAAAVMMAHMTFEREREERRYHNMRRSRYRRSMFEGLFFEWLLDSLNAGDKTKRSIARVIYYIAWFFLGALIYGVYSYARYRKLTPYAVIWGAVGGLAGGFIQRFFREEDTFLKALVNCIVEFVLLAIAVVLVLVVKVK